MVFLAMALLQPSMSLLAGESDAGLPRQTLDEIRRRVLVLHNSVSSLEVVYCKSMASGNPRDPIDFDRHHFAVKDKYRYRENVHFSEEERGHP
jgi:hypothetical protein